ncbi:MFS transporter [Saccharicrinis sp. FJH2]|uniref:MFS transporter n=1 Tax=Saccharicrinis sp. FJH65 TaxID=3344659 RepID=UPI0035F43A31
MTTDKQGIGKYRWRILALLFFATTINYMDRSIIGVLAPTLQYKVFNWSDVDYATINIFFKIAYAVGMLTMGGIIDRFGTRIGYTLAIGIWSIFGMLHAAVRPAFSLIGFSLARFGLGFGESGNFPAAIKTVAEWFPKKERAFATGIFNAGSNVGAILAPLVIPLIVLSNGEHWQYAFLTTGAFSALWVVLWLLTYKKPEKHPKLSKEELEYINSDSVVESSEKLSWGKLLPVKETWAFALAKMTDAVWWFYLFWGGKFLFDMFGLNIHSIALPLIVIYVLADGGSIGGGWMSSYFIKKGWTVNKARKITLLICALLIMPVMFVTQVQTGFKVTPDAISKLETEQVKVDKQMVNVPVEVINQVKLLEGKEYKAARNFQDDLATGYGKAKLENLMSTLVSNSETSSGTYMITDKTIEAVNNMQVEDAVMLSLKKINSKKVENKEKASLEAFKGYVEKEVGKETIGTFEFAVFDATRTNNLYWIAVLLIALAAAGHQAWSANLFTLVSDVFPKKATASVTGIGGMLGAVAGIAADKALGDVLNSSGPSAYFFAFLIAGLSYLILLGVVHVIMPKMTPLDENLKHVNS